MDRLRMRSVGKTEENIKKLGELFPGCLVERQGENGAVEYGIDFAMLRQELSPVLQEGEERYQFTWPGKKRSILLANTPAAAMTLRPCRQESVDFDGTQNLYIEGDNLDVLKLLRETYLGKVKMIYIDPPYNTGRDSFVYHDDFAMEYGAFAEASGQHDAEGNLLFDLRRNNESSGRFHSDWLNMIYPRLKLARDLLTEDGAILINMDEHEIANLQKICQEIFGERNDLGTIVWDKRNPKGDAQGISCQHEYILVYAREKETFLANNRLQRPKKNAAAILKKAGQLYAKLSKSYTLEDANRDFGIWMRSQPDFSGGERAYHKIDENGDVYRAVSMAWPNKQRAPEDYFVPLIHPATGKPCPVPERGWRNPSATMQRMQKAGQILFGKDETTIPNSKYLLKENLYENIPSLLYYGGSDTAFLSGIGVPFDTPKVAEICREHILAFTSGEDIVMDFFSGSGTVAHGVMLANAEDGGRRRYIMVQLPEACGKNSPLGRRGFSNICEAGKERIRRTAERIAGDLDRGFRVLKLDTTNMKDVYYTPDAYEPGLLDSVADNIKEDRTPEDLLFQVMLELGILLSSKIEESTVAGKRVFTVAEGELMACFDAEVTEEAIREIAGKRPRYFVLRDSSMASDSVAANFEQIFAAYSPQTVRKVL